MLPQNYVKLEGKQAQQMLKLMEALEEHDDTQERLVELRRRGTGNRGLAGVRIFGIDPGSVRTGYGCVETDGTRHRLVTCGALAAPAGRLFPIACTAFTTVSRGCSGARAPIASPIENLFHARNVRSALMLGHARGVAVLAAVAGRPAASSSTPPPKSSSPSSGTAAPKRRQVQQMVKLLLGLDAAPSPHDAADALAVAICHAHSGHGRARPRRPRGAAARAQLAPRAPARSSAGVKRRDRPPRRHAAREAGASVSSSMSAASATTSSCRCRPSMRSATPGAAVALRIHTHVREDALQLFGFATPLEQPLFERLIAISGIGPKLALAVLSGIEPADLVRAIRRGDLARLTRIPGVGRRPPSASSLELRDRLPELPRPTPADACRRPAGGVARRSAVGARQSRLSAPRSRRRWTRVLRASRRAGRFEPLLRDMLREMSRAMTRSPPRQRVARRRRRAVRGGAAAAHARATTSARSACARTSRCRLPRPASAARRSTTCCCTVRPASARRRWPT